MLWSKPLLIKFIRKTYKLYLHNTYFSGYVCEFTDINDQIYDQDYIFWLKGPPDAIFDEHYEIKSFKIHFKNIICQLQDINTLKEIQQHSNTGILNVEYNSIDQYQTYNIILNCTIDIWDRDTYGYLGG